MNRVMEGMTSGVRCKNRAGNVVSTRCRSGKYPAGNVAASRCTVRPGAFMGMGPHHCFRRLPVTIGKSSRSPTAVCLAASLLVEGPPPDYRYLKDVDNTRHIISSRYPDLMDLVDNGTLVVSTRPANYVERRSDGYREPEELFIVGTAHISKKSAEAVSRVIQAVAPQNVVVEVCRSRSAVLYEPPTPSGASSKSSKGNWSPLLLAGSSWAEALTRSIRLGGQSALLLRILLANLYRNAADSLTVEPGQEFRAAAQAADAVGAQLVLGDRPIEITLERAWSALPWQRKLDLCKELLRASMSRKTFEGITEEQLQEMMQDDFISSAFQQMGQRYPELLPPLVHERDLYLAWSLKRSKAVNGCQRVVGVIGKGHVRGVVYALSHDSSNLRFTDLVGGKNTASSKKADAQKAVARVVWEILLAAGLYFAWEEWQGHGLTRILPFL